MLQGLFQMIPRKFGFANRPVNAPQHQMTRAQVFSVVPFLGERERLLEI